MASCGGVALPGRQRSRWKSAGFDVVEGVGADLRSVYVWRARPAAVIGGDDDSVLVAVVGLAWGWLVGVLFGRRGS